MGGRGNDPERTEESLARLRDWLHAEAGRHEPDRERIWARIEAGIEAGMDHSAEPLPADDTRLGDSAGRGHADEREDARDGARGGTRRGGRHAGSSRRWPRVGLASLCTAGVVGLTSGVFWGFTERGVGPALPLAGRSSDQAESPSATDSSTPGESTRTGTSTPAAPSSPSASRSSSPPRRPESKGATPEGHREKPAFAASGALDPNSSAYWAQNNVALRVHKPLRALTVTVRVRRGERVVPTGSWLSLPNGDFQSSTETNSDVIVYKWTLLPGRTVWPGSYTLAAQYNRTSAHDPRGDDYTVRATTRDGPSSSSAEGHF